MKVIKAFILIFLSVVVIGCYSNYYQQGKIYEQRKDYSSAIQAYSKMAEKSGSKGRAIAQGEIGRLYVKFGKYWKAKEILEEAKKGLKPSDSQYADVCFNLGYCYYEIGEEWYNQALTEFKRAIRTKEDFSKAHLYTGIIYYKNKEYEGAINHLISVTGEREVRAKYIAGICYWRLSEYNKAADMIRESVELERTPEVKTKYRETLSELMVEIERIKREAEKIVAVDIKPVFASMYKYYAENPIGTVVIRNQTEEIMRDVKVFLNVPSFMDEPTLNPVDNIPPGGRTVVELKAVFNQKMHEVQDDIENKPVSLILEYTTNEGKISEAKQGEYIDIYDINATNWEPSESIAAFVAHENPTVHTIARYVANADNTLEKAIQVYETLDEYGIEYSLDPDVPYGADIDYVMYPWETLKVKKGDCDDLSVLYAACLQNIGINTALVLTPSHVFVMFDSGMSSSRASRVILDPNLYRIEKGTAWIPVEVTMLGRKEKSFFDAWLKGKEEYNPELERIYINQAWQEFKPAWTGPEIEIELPDKNAVFKEYYNNIVKAKKYWQGIIDDEIQYLLAELKSQPTNKAQIRNRLGINYAMKGKFVKAEEQFRQAILLEPSVIRYHNNLANVLLLKANNMTASENITQKNKVLKKAEEEYQKALESAPDSASIRVNMAIYYFAQQKPDEAQRIISESPDKDKLIVIAHELGIPVTSSPKAGELQTIIEDKTQKAANIQEKRKKLIAQIIRISNVYDEKKQELEKQLLKLSVDRLQKITEDKSLFDRSLVANSDESTKISSEQMRELIQEAVGSTEISGTRAAGISEPEELQWWLSWMK